MFCLRPLYILHTNCIPTYCVYNDITILVLYIILLINHDEYADLLSYASHGGPCLIVILDYLSFYAASLWNAALSNQLAGEMSLEKCGASLEDNAM